MDRYLMFLIQRLCVILIIGTFLGGCSFLGGNQQDSVGNPPASTQAPLAPSPTGTPLPERTETPKPATPVYFTSTPEAVHSPQPTSTNTPTPQPMFCSPLEGHTLADLQEILTNGYSPPPPGKDTGHHGVDFAYYRRGERASILGVKIQSVLAGRAAAAILNRIPYGNMVIVETSYERLPDKLLPFLEIIPGESLYLLYAHMNAAPLVKLGNPVACGQDLGEVGSTPKGWSSDPHLHLEARVGPAGAVFRGMVFYDTGATLEEMDNYKLWRMSGEFKLVDPMGILEIGLGE